MNDFLSQVPYYGWLLALVGLTLLLTGLSALLARRARPGEGYNAPARFFLVCLRLAIGWHCFVEGMDKLHNPAWSSEPYLRESVGPLSGTFRGLVGNDAPADEPKGKDDAPRDPTGDRLRERITVVTENELPHRMALDYYTYLDAFADHYGLSDEQRQKAENTLDQELASAYAWLQSGTEEVEKVSSQPPALKLDMTMRQRLREHDRLRREVAKAESFLPSADPDVQKRYRDAKADLARWRAGLQKSYDAQFAKYKAALRDVLTKEQKSYESAQKTAGPVEPAPIPIQYWQPLDFADAAVTWGLIVLGALLMVGLFARFSSLLTALLLFSFYIAMVPLPGWPESPRLEGHYLIVNKTLIEVIALLALTFIPTGRWAGLDALLGLMFGRAARTEPATRVPVGEEHRRTVQPVG